MVYKCGGCNFVLHTFERVGQDFYGIPTPSEVLSWYGGLCPRCGRRLTKPGISDVVVMDRRLAQKLRVRTRYEVLPVRPEVLGVQLEGLGLQTNAPSKSAQGQGAGRS